jgi:hypothetical protein
MNINKIAGKVYTYLEKEMNYHWIDYENDNGNRSSYCAKDLIKGTYYGIQVFFERGKLYILKSNRKSVEEYDIESFEQVIKTIKESEEEFYNSYKKGLIERL